MIYKCILKFIFVNFEKYYNYKWKDGVCRCIIFWMVIYFLSIIRIRVNKSRSLVISLIIIGSNVEVVFCFEFWILFMMDGNWMLFLYINCIEVFVWWLD